MLIYFTIGYDISFNLLLLPRSIPFAKKYTLFPNSERFARLYLMSNKTLIFRLSPTPYLRKLIHLTLRKSTTPFSPNTPASPPRIKVSARATRRFQHGTRGQEVRQKFSSVRGNISIGFSIIFIILSVRPNKSKPSQICIIYFKSAIVWKLFEV